MVLLLVIFAFCHFGDKRDHRSRPAKFSSHPSEINDGPNLAMHRVPQLPTEQRPKNYCICRGSCWPIGLFHHYVHYQELPSSNGSTPKKPLQLKGCFGCLAGRVREKGKNLSWQAWLVATFLLPFALSTSQFVFSQALVITQGIFGRKHTTVGGIADQGPQCWWQHLFFFVSKQQQLLQLPESVKQDGVALASRAQVI